MAKKDLEGVKDLSTLSAQDIDSISEAMGKRLVEERIKTNQIRNLYSAVQSIRASYEAVTLAQSGVTQALPEKISRRLIFLKPKLAYAKGRQPKLEPLRSLLASAIDGVVGASAEPHLALENFFAMVEFIVAYHKFHGGQDK